MQTTTVRPWRKRLAAALGIVLVGFMLWLWFIVNQLPDTLKPDPAKPIGVLFNNVRVLSMADQSSVAPTLQAVLVMGDRITQIGVAGEIAAPAGVLVIDGQGNTLMPGLIDAHIHLHDETELAAYLAHGVTAVRNMSGYPFHLRLIAQKAKGQLIAPDVLTTGPVLNSDGPNAMILQTSVSTAEQAGVPLLTGTDSGSFGIIPGESVARELELLVAAGLSPLEALTSATRRNAEILCFAKTGQILPGYRANLELLAKDPLTDVAVVQQPVGVLIDGYYLDAQKLAALQETARQSKLTVFFRSLVRVVEMKLLP